MKPSVWPSTGLSGLDNVLNYLRDGDNIVWQLDDIKDYKVFVRPLVKKALQEKKKVVYMRFAAHEQLLEAGDGVTVCTLDANNGFESFSTQVHEIIREKGAGVYYVFDCLTDLLVAWASDSMIGNFFMVTCPYLFELDTITYFAILRNNHSYKTIARIRETTQLLIDLYDFEGKYYIHPLKVWNRYSPTMFLPHMKEGDSFTPLTNSVETAKLFSYISKKGLENAERNLDYWDRLFIKAEELLSSTSLDKKFEMINLLCKIMIGREKRMLALARSNFSIDDLLNIKSRLIGTGYIGGKAVGMLLSRKILQKEKSVNWGDYLEPHDSFYIGSDVFYKYLVQNGLWKLRMEQRTKEGYFRVADELKQRMMTGKLPDELKEQLWEMIEYFGQSPIIIRSSSLLEDSFGNAFAGKYESIFVVNQGSPEERYRKIEEVVKKIFSSTMSEDALTYRLQRGLDQQDEQMALLIQRVSGSNRGSYFFPDAAGVGISHNTFTWKENMDPKAGMLRLVFGLGTRAVNRVEDDYPRIAALDDPLLRPNAGKEDDREFSQHKIDLLNIEANELQEMPISELMAQKPGVEMKFIGAEDRETTNKMKELGMKGRESWIISFNKLFTETPFKDIMQRLMKTLENTYQYPVDIEFTLNFTEKDDFKLNLLQCRPLQTIGYGKKVEIPLNVKKENILFQSHGNFMGGNIAQYIKRIIYVDPAKYDKLTIPEKYEVARLVGNLNKRIDDRDKLPALLVGPGRWGTSTPSLGVPVSFAEINNISVLVELEYSGGHVSPELSFGTHFFQDLVETNIFYVAIFASRDKAFFNDKFLDKYDDILSGIMGGETKHGGIVKVYDLKEGELQVMADIVSQNIVCFRP
ncbi:MAG: PEP/pyruvate-binding domain-containing protein [Elusimicrobiota bacterium]